MIGNILVAGDANLDLIVTGDVVPRFGQVEQLVDGGQLVLGGSAAIVAHGLARLGVPTRFVTRVGDDEFGRIAVAALAAAGVAVDAVRVDDTLPTGLSIILSTPHDRAILTIPGTIPSLTGVDVRSELGPSGHLHVASYFLQPALAAGLPGLLSAARSRGLTTSLDTNWDPSGRWTGLVDVLPYVDIFFPNLKELRAIAHALGSPIDKSDEDHARRIATLGPLVVVKAGAEGGWSLARDSDITVAQGLLIDVVDTTGAGDSFNAGYLAAMARGVTDEYERLHWATIAGSLSTRAAGGTGAQADMLELAKALRS
jgi:ribokinase